MTPPRGAVILAIGVGLLAVPARADDAANPSSATLLQEGAKLTKACGEPKADWTEAKLSGNFDACNTAVQAFVQAMETSKDPTTAKTATQALTLLNVNLGETGLRIGQHHAQKDEGKLALAFLHVACTSFDAVSAFDKPTPDQAAAMQAGATEADRLLQGYHTNCKDILAPDK